MTQNTAGREGPIRATPFAPPCGIAGNERELLLECLDSGHWSSFFGSTGGRDLREVATMPSAEAGRYGPTDMCFLGGRFVREAEALFAEMWQVPFAVSANSATSCLAMAAGALDLEPGDEILMPPMSFNATSAAVLYTGVVPVFCEVKDDTFCLDPTDLEHRITERTKAIMVVHLGGSVADMDGILAVARKNGLKVIEDAAQSPAVPYKGQWVGTFGDAGVFSFTESKNITCGEGGMLVTRDPAIAQKARLIRNHGEGIVGADWPAEDLVNIVGMNYRLTEFQAAVLVPQLRALAERNRVRIENGRHLTERLAAIPNLVRQATEPDSGYVPYILKWRWRPEPGQPSRDELVAGLNAEGIPVSRGYGGRMMHQNPMFVRRIAFGAGGWPFGNTAPAYGDGTLPRSEMIDSEMIWFRFVNGPNSFADMDDVAKAFERVLSRTV